jgi:hypothetical protein
MIDRVNLLYTQTDWGLDNHGRRLVNMGFMIRDITIQTAPTLTRFGQEHYNMRRDEAWGVADLLNVLRFFTT